jgi:5-methyltetrahydropteroyltriglutamate--homocysteine methyltransferase
MSRNLRCHGTHRPAAITTNGSAAAMSAHPAGIAEMSGFATITGQSVATRHQIHTHLCYSKFGDTIGAIEALDADFTTVEAARSRMEFIADLTSAGFERGIGPGAGGHPLRDPSQARAIVEVPIPLAAGARAVPRLQPAPRGHGETLAGPGVKPGAVALARDEMERT